MTCRIWHHHELYIDLMPLKTGQCSCPQASRAFVQPQHGMPLSKKDDSLVRLFMTACYHQWEKLPMAGRSCLETGAAHAEVQGCIRHMCV